MTAQLTEPVEGGGERFSDDALAAVRLHPRFGEAVRSCITVGLELCRERAVHRLNRDLGHYLLAILAIHVHVAGGLSLGRLQELCVETGLCSRDRAIALFLLLRTMRFIHPLPRRGDQRVRWFAPTPALMVAFRARMAGDLAAAVMIRPEAQAALDRIDEEALFNSFMRTFGEGVIAAARVHQPRDPSLEMFSGAAGGMMMLYEIMLTGEEGDLMPPRGRVRISVNALSRTCRISRAQVLKLLRRAEAVDFLRRDARGGSGMLQPALIAEIELYFALMFLSLTHCARMAMIETSQVRTAERR